MYYNFDRFQGKARVKTIYDWTRRDYQEVVVIDIGSNIHQPIRLPQGIYRGMGAEEVAKTTREPENKLTQHERIRRYLEAHGAQTAAQIGLALGMTSDMAAQILPKYPLLFEREAQTKPIRWRLVRYE